MPPLTSGSVGVMVEKRRYRSDHYRLIPVSAVYTRGERLHKIRDRPLTPAILIVRLLLGLTAFITSIASSILGLTVSLFALLSLVEFFIGYWQNGIAFLVLALLVSPIGLPAIANLLLNRLDHMIGFLEGLLC